MVNYDNNSHHRHHRTVMEHLWKATREKLLSGKNNFRNENDLLLPICITFAVFFRYAGTEKNDEGKKNHFIIMPLLFCYVLSFFSHFSALLHHLNGELLIEVKELICWSSEEERAREGALSVNDKSKLYCRFALLTSLHSPQTNPLRILSDDFFMG